MSEFNLQSNEVYGAVAIAGAIGVWLIRKASLRISNIHIVIKGGRPRKEKRKEKPRE